jgi:hypothetical protein
MSAFNRKQSRFSYRINMFFVTEGEASEKAYLSIVWNRLKLRERYNARFSHQKSSIPSLMETAQLIEKSAEFNPKRGDEIWIILDHDEQCHFPEQFEALGAWEKAKGHRHVAISTPRFEYWLLWHVEEKPTKKNALSDDYVQKLIPNFKALPQGTPSITEERIMMAMKRANASSRIPNCENPGVLGSGLGRLVERLLQS